MPFLNEATIMGNLGQTPEVRYTAERVPVTNLSVATNRRFKRAGSEKWEEDVTWHSVVVFGTHAETCAKHLAQGDRVLVKGRLQTREYDSNGQKKRVTEIVADPGHPLFLSPRHSEPDAPSEASS